MLLRHSATNDERKKAADDLLECVFPEMFDIVQDDDSTNEGKSLAQRITGKWASKPPDSVEHARNYAEKALKNWWNDIEKKKGPGTAVPVPPEVFDGMPSHMNSGEAENRSRNAREELAAEIARVQDVIGGSLWPIVVAVARKAKRGDQRLVLWLILGGVSHKQAKPGEPWQHQPGLIQPGLIAELRRRFGPNFIDRQFAPSVHQHMEEANFLDAAAEALRVDLVEHGLDTPTAQELVLSLRNVTEKRIRWLGWDAFLMAGEVTAWKRMDREAQPERWKRLATNFVPRRPCTPTVETIKRSASDPCALAEIFRKDRANLEGNANEARAREEVAGVAGLLCEAFGGGQEAQERWGNCLDANVQANGEPAHV
jgi:hypothetical protein